MENETFGELLVSLDKQRKNSSDKLESGDNWGEYGSGPELYEKFLGLEEGELKSKCDAVPDHPPLVLDVMGDGTVLEKLNVGGAAISLTDKRGSAQKDRHNELDIDFVDGDILKSNTWKRVRKTGKQFDLILFRPGAGISFITDKAAFHAWILKKMWQMLNVNGEIIAQIPSGSEELLKDWVSKLGNNSGAEGSVQDVYWCKRLLLRKTKESPEDIFK